MVMLVFYSRDDYGDGDRTFSFSQIMVGWTAFGSSHQSFLTNYLRFSPILNVIKAPGFTRAKLLRKL